jgi:hypothetical protein
VEEHWNWREGSTVSVVGYTNVQEVLLTLNGRPIGTTSVADAVDGVLTWEVPFSSGVLKAVGRVNGRQVAEFTLTTAGAASRIELVASHRLPASGASLSAPGRAAARQVVHRSSAWWTETVCVRCRQPRASRSTDRRGATSQEWPGAQRTRTSRTGRWDAAF